LSNSYREITNKKPKVPIFFLNMRKNKYCKFRESGMVGSVSIRGWEVIVPHCGM
jgi:hypothetical protein